MLSEDADVYAGVQGYPLFTMSRNPRASFPRRNRCSQHGCIFLDFWIGGANRDRTDDLKLAKLALSQLSYGPNPGGA